MHAAQPRAQARGQRILTGARQILQPHPGRVDTTARTARNRKRNTLRTAMHHHRRLGPHLIDAVQHHIALGQQHRHVLRVNERLDRIHHAVRMNIPHPRHHGLHLGQPQGGLQGMRLPVQIALGHMIQINERQPPHPGTGQHLHRPRPDAADADHAHMRRRQAIEPGLPIQALDTGKTAGNRGQVLH